MQATGLEAVWELLEQTVLTMDTGGTMPSSWRARRDGSGSSGEHVGPRAFGYDLPFRSVFA